MTAHKKRNGQLIVSWDCQQGRHGDACLAVLAEFGIDDPIACHCPCHPDDGCRPTIVRRQNRRGRVCPGCQQVKPLAGACENCK